MNNARRGLCGRRRVKEMKRIAAMLDNAIHIRDLTSLEYSLALHVLQERLGWPGLYCLLPQWATRAQAVQKSVEAEQSMAAQVSTTVHVVETALTSALSIPMLPRPAILIHSSLPL